MAFRFDLQAVDGRARYGKISTLHGEFETPIFMPVGTRATIKGVTSQHLRDMKAKIILGNTYHLTLRPGDELIRDVGGLHRFMDWQQPILTDSGGFQIFSLGHLRRLTDEGAVFKSHLDGTLLELTPEKAVKIQENLGSDIAMVLDECPSANSTDEEIQIAVNRTILWAKRSLQSQRSGTQSLFAIVQGGMNLKYRQFCAEELVKLDFPGYALGGFSVGESPEQMHALLPECASMLPELKPRYLMGVGRPIDLLEAVDAGIDMFDCVMPTRNGRNGMAFTNRGIVRLRNSMHQREMLAIQSDCSCYCCQTTSRAYIHHLLHCDEMLGGILVSLHNLHFYLELMQECREAIREQRFQQFRQQCLAQWALAV